MLLRARLYTATLFDAWLQRAGDREKHMGEWIRHGAPLGMARKIPVCGVFPEMDEDAAADMALEIAELMNRSAGNYSSIHEKTLMTLNRKSTGYWVTISGSNSASWNCSSASRDTKDAFASWLL